MATAISTGIAPRRIFISYARKDGAETAQTLRTTLEAANHTVWLDTDRIHGGASWSKAIESALNNCDVLLAILTPAAYLSEICRAEQIWALDEGKLVIPVLATNDAKSIPLYLKALNYRRFPEHQSDLLNDLTTEPATETQSAARPLRYNTIPNLPQNHVTRDSALDELRNLVFTEGASGNIAVTAMAGMGGIGKTVLATALCRDPAIQRAFPDGIAWITIGREYNGDSVIRMREVARALGDDLSNYDNPLACEHRYRTILREKAALIVVDDIWNLEHLKPLLVDAPRSRFLFTTRDTGIAKAITHRRYSANLLNHDEARLLLSRWSGADPLPLEADQIIRECGDLAAAISQIGATLSDVSPAEWRDTLQALQHADITAIEDRLPPGQQSFFKSLEVSFKALPEAMQTRYLKLAVLLEDVPAPLAVLQTLWQSREAEARQIARYLVDRSLAFWKDTADPARGIRLHDLQLDYVRALFKDHDALALIHSALRNSAHVVANYPEEFASQMIGRLLPYKDVSSINVFAGQLTGSSGRWLRPLWPSLHPPGTALVRTLAGHSGFVKRLALTADGKYAVSASADHTLKLWDVESGRELRTLVGHYSVSGVALTADGRLVVSASADKTLKVWDAKSGRELHTLAGHSSGVNAVAITADGKRAVSASADKTLKVWDAESGRELHTLAGHSSGVNAVAITANGKRAVSASEDQTLKIWDVESGHELLTLYGHSGSVYRVAITADGTRALSASIDETLKLWDVESGRELRTLASCLPWVYGVALTGEGTRAVSAASDKTLSDKALKVWDVESGLEIATLTGHSDRINGAALTMDGKLAVSASADKTLKVWDLGSGRELHRTACHADSVNAVALTADGKRAASASSDSTVKVWDVESGRELRTLIGHSHDFLDRGAFVHGVALTIDGKRAVSASDDSTLKVWDVESGRATRTLEGHSGSVTGVAITADGKRAMSVSTDKTLRLWDLDSGRQVRTWPARSPAVIGVALTANGKLAVSASIEKKLKVWDVESGSEVRRLSGHFSSVNGVALTTDGRRAVSASSDNRVKVWDVESGRALRTLVGHLDDVNGVALTADEKHVLSASDDNTLKVWHLESGTCVATFHCDAPVRCCACSGNRLILAGDSAGRLHLLSIEGL
jgi:WD40 repeat protein